MIPRFLRPMPLPATLILLGLLSPVHIAQAEVVTPPPTPQGPCGEGSRPETGMQGRVPPADHASGRAAEGYTCNTEAVGSYTFMSKNYEANPFGTVGGFKVHRYVDKQGQVCAFYDTTLLAPTSLFDAEVGINVLDMSDPANPVHTARLTTPAMISPHESLVLSEERGLLAAVLGNPSIGPGVVDIYDVSEDCTQPVLKTSAPVGVFGHESGMSPDGNIFYSASPATPTLTAIDIRDPMLPRPIWTGEYYSHGLSLSADGNRAYVAHTPRDRANGLLILDVSEIQAAVTDPTAFGNPFPGTSDPSGQTREPQAYVVSELTWDTVSIPQNAIPVTIGGKPYVIEIDEYSSNAEGGGGGTHGSIVGAGRIIDISDETKPRVISDLRLAVHQPEVRDEIANDPGASMPAQGYAGHYCGVPTRVEPTIVACSMIVSGLRIFDIRDPANPVEVAYFNAPIPPRATPGIQASNWAMSAPAFVPERKEIWYTDGFSGFYVVRVTNDAWPDNEQEKKAKKEKKEKAEKEKSK